MKKRIAIVGNKKYDKVDGYSVLTIEDDKKVCESTYNDFHNATMCDIDDGRKLTPELMEKVYKKLVERYSDYDNKSEHYSLKDSPKEKIKKWARNKKS